MLKNIKKCRKMYIQNKFKEEFICKYKYKYKYLNRGG